MWRPHLLVLGLELSKSKKATPVSGRLELMPVGRALAGRAMTPSWGNGVSWLGPTIQHLWATLPKKFILTKLPIPPYSQKKLPLHSWRPLVHNSHIEYISPWMVEDGKRRHGFAVMEEKGCEGTGAGNQNSIYVMTPPQFISNWLRFHSRSEPKACKWMSIKHVMNLEVKKYQILISIELIMYATCHLKGSFVILKWNSYLCAIFSLFICIKF